MANDYRGEVDLRVGERDVTLRLTLDAVRRLERACGKGWQEIARCALTDSLHLDDAIRIVVLASQHDESQKITVKDVEAHVDSDGFGPVAAAAKTVVLLQSIGTKAAGKVMGRGEGEAGSIGSE